MYEYLFQQINILTLLGLLCIAVS